MKSHINFTLIFAMLFAILLPTPDGAAQPSLSKADSLFEILRGTSDSTRPAKANDVVQHFLELPFPDARAQARRTIDIANVWETPVLQAAAWEGMMDLYLSHQMVDSALYAADQALSHIEICEHTYCLQLRPHLLGEILKANSNAGRPQHVLYLVDSLLKTEIDEETKLHIQTYKAHAFSELGAHDLALQLHLEHLRNPVIANNPAKKLITLEALGLTYIYLGKLDKAFYWSEKALAPARIHLEGKDLLTVLYGHLALSLEVPGFKPAVFKQAIELSEEIYQRADQLDPEKGYFHGVALEEYVNAYRRMDDLDNAAVETKIALLEQMAGRQKPYALIHTRRNAFCALARYYSDIGRHDKAVDFAHKHLAHIVKSVSDTAELLQFAFEELHKIEAAAGNYAAAYQALQSFHECTMVMRDRTQAMALAQASAALDLDDAQLSRWQAEQAAKSERKASAARTRIFWMVFLTSTIILAVLSWAYQRSRRDSRLIARQNQIVSQSLSEKEVLLREIHHRVKNNLQIISSLLQSQADIADSAEVSKLVTEGQERIHSMALIHQHLYQSKDLDAVNIKNYLRDLTANIERSYSEGTSPIVLSLKAADEKLDIDTAIPVGLILNELITNAYKYAFPDGKSGKIIVEFGKVAERFRLKVSDNGIGIPATQNLRKKNSLGLSLVNGLVRQLDGQISWDKQIPGTTVAIEF